MDDTQLLRYSRHILLSELGVDAQQRFGESHALIVGIGGLGNPVAQFLAAAGVGTLTLIDADRVDLTNLQRQILFDTDAVGRPKVEAAAARIAAVNPEVRVVQLADRVGLSELAPLAAAAPEQPQDREHVFHKYVLRVDHRDTVRAALAERGVSTLVHYGTTLSALPFAAVAQHRGGGKRAARFAREVLSLPIHAQLREDEIERVCDALAEAIPPS